MRKRPQNQNNVVPLQRLKKSGKKHGYQNSTSQKQMLRNLVIMRLL